MMTNLKRSLAIVSVLFCYGIADACPNGSSNVCFSKREDGQCLQSACLENSFYALGGVCMSPKTLYVINASKNSVRYSIYMLPEQIIAPNTAQRWLTCSTDLAQISFNRGQAMSSSKTSYSLKFCGISESEFACSYAFKYSESGLDLFYVDGSGSQY
ncbi:MAG: hypothetical protein HQK54_04450 [Oligoflexales bacterium]|nr:hypothetical protein [Oligoflexales bacterium]